MCIWAVMFVGAQLWGGWQRDQQAAELKKYGEERRAEADIVGKCTPAPCAKVKLLETAVSLKWTPEQVATVAKALGLK